MEATTVVFRKEPIHVPTAYVQPFSQISNGQIHLLFIKYLIEEPVDNTVNIIPIILFGFHGLLRLENLTTSALPLNMDQ